MSDETVDETLARHERQIAALKAALKELLAHLDRKTMMGVPEDCDVLSVYSGFTDLLESGE